MFRRAWLFSFAYALFAVASYGREGFGFTKKAAEFNRTIPPAINVAGSTVNVALDTERGRSSGQALKLRQSVENAIVAGDKKLQSVSDGGDVRVLIALDRIHTERINQSKVEDHYVKEKDSNGKSHEVNHPETKYYTTVHASLAGNYKILDAKGQMLDSGDIDRNYDEDFEYSTPDSDKVEGGLIDWAAAKVAARIVPTHQRTKVILPKGSFEQFIPYAESGAWDKYLQGVESVRPLNDRASDAYREFALGIANEAVAYQSEDPKQALDMLRKAAEHYRTATANNRNEPLFSERYTSIFGSASAPIDRADASVKAYESWTSGATTAAAPPSKALRNQQIIDMAKAGLGDDIIMLAIEKAPATDFETTPDALITLSKAGVSKSVIAKMQKR
jgi:hypothetical protein